MEKKKKATTVDYSFTDIVVLNIIEIKEVLDLHMSLTLRNQLHFFSNIMMGQSNLRENNKVTSGFF